ncbi:PAS domain S-box protein [Terasakiella sp. SH-1]|uniref:PAS domain S-box protein n=1 Tax=Terasakiella sp. SH-1 TaxID=2560057 RepID=UPI001073C7C2|nr:PAS domain S-box protein [Terasakiella sp. SH-1]
MSFRLKTILGVATIEIALLVILVWSSLNILHKSHEEELQRQADVIISLLVNATRDALISYDLETLDKVGNDLLKSPAIASIKMMDVNGVTLYDHQATGQRSSSVNRLKIVALEGQKFGQVEIALSRSFVEAASDKARQQMIAIAMVEVMLVALFSYMLGTYLTRELNQLRQASRRIADGELGVQLTISSEDEIGETAKSFNRMSSRLNELYGEIQVNEKRLRTVLNTVNDGILTIDSKGILLSVNPAVSDLFGYGREELLGRNVSMLMPQPDRKCHDGYIQKYMNTGQGRIIGNRRRVTGLTKAGESVSLELSVNPMELEGETLFVGTLRDLTQEVTAQKEARDAETRLVDAIENSNDGFVLYDENDRLVVCNQRYREIYASSADLLYPGNTFSNIIETGVKRGQYPEAKGREDEWIAQRMDAHLHPKGPVEQKLDNGNWIRVWENKTESGAIVGFRIDITELKKREEALLESQNRFRATIDSALDCIICVDGQGKVVEFNPAAEKCFGYTREEALDQEMASLIIPERLRDAHRKGMAHYHQTGEGPVLGKRIEVQALRKNGEEFPIELAIEMASGNHEEVLFVSYLRDITEQKAYENNLKEAKQRAEVANEAKAGFLAMMSHEIRTPLNGVLGVMGLMSETRLDDEQCRYVRTAKESGEALLSIINDVLDFSKMEAGKLQFEESDVELQPLVASITDLLGSQARAKGLAFSATFDPALPWSVLCDGGRLRQILLNLLGNAVKFTEKGGVEITALPIKQDEDSHRLRFEVKDTGIGIPDNLQDQVFGEFSTIDASYARKFGGTGLGLAITRKLVEIMGGDIGFVSQEGKGSTFWVELDLKTGFIVKDKTVESTIISTKTQRPLRILIAEDHPTNMIITRMLLQKQGHQVVAAADGVEAVQMAQEFPLDLILMDGSMPEMDGLEATRRIRQMDGQVKNIPIIALTAHAMKGDREKFLEAGMDDYLQKPIQKEAVLACIAKWSGEDISVDFENVQPNTTDQLLDKSYLEKLAEDTDPEMVPELIDIYLQDARERLERVRIAIAEGDFDMLELETHTLGSSAANYGLIPLHQLARRAEAACVGKKENQALQLSEELISVAEESWAMLAGFRLDEA